jgi:MSHA biogenesis protein MshL
MNRVDGLIASLRIATRAALCASLLAGAATYAQDTSAQVEAPVVRTNGQRFDINVEDAPARAFFMGLVDGTPVNMLVDPQVSGRVTLQLKQVTLEEALNAVRDLYGYDYRRFRNGYMVLPATIQSRVFTLNFIDVNRVGISKTRISSGQVSQQENGSGASGGTGGSSGDSSESSDVTGTAVLTRSGTDFWKAVENDLKAMIGATDGSGKSVIINRQSGVIVARGLPSELRDIGDYLTRTENTITRQVILEAKVVEVELSDAYQAGINWAAVLSDGNKRYTIGQMAPPGGFDANPFVPSGDTVTVAPGNPIDGFINSTLGGAFTIAADFTDFNAYIELLGLQGRTRVLSSPRVSTLHNQKAIIKAGTDEFFITGVHSDTTTGESTTTTVEYDLTPFFSGVALDVTPQISADNRVLLHIHPTISDVNDQQKTLVVRGQTDVLPLALSQIRESDSIVKARSGQIIVIGGLMRESRSRDEYKTPLLGDIPGIGRLFRSERDQSKTTELVILLRPLVVGDDDWQPLVDEPNQRLEELAKKGDLK